MYFEKCLVISNQNLRARRTLRIIACKFSQLCKQQELPFRASEPWSYKEDNVLETFL